MIYAGKGLFALEKAIPALKGYYMDAENKVYSTRQKSTPQLLKGTKTANGFWYCLDGRTFTSVFLEINARRHTDFMNDTASVSHVGELIQKGYLKGTPADRSHAKSLQDGIDKKGWVIAQVSVHEGIQHLVFGSQPAIHTTSASVTAELQRLATSKPGTKFVSLKVDRTLVSGGLVWN